jgi:LacI family transcriptional regulator
LMEGKATQIDVTRIEPLDVVVRQSTDVVAVADARVAAVVRYAQAHACEGINVADLLRAVPMARTALERRCQASLACTPRELLERIRLDHVRKWLRDSDASMEEIAERTGYSYPEYLTVAFKRVEGVTPRAWRLKRRYG